MTRQETEQRYYHLCDHIFNRRIKTALDEISQLIRFSSKTDYFLQLESLSENYQSLLRFSFQGYQDPQQTLILNNLCASILSLADEIRYQLLMPELPLKDWERKTIQQHFSGKSLSEASPAEEILFHGIDSVFKMLWLTGKMKDREINFVRKVRLSDSIEWHEKSLIVSALTLSLVHYFDPVKLILLIEFAENHEDQVYQRAVTGLVIGLLIHDKRIRFLPDVISKLEAIREDENIRNDIEIILFQMLLARETEKITREFEEEVLPDMKKMMPLIEDKLQLGEITEEDDPDGQNPKWKGLIDEVPGLFEKIEKFSKMQMEGADVFMSTFQQLKRFDFFSSMCNWFVPFYPDHPELTKTFSGQVEINRQLIEGLEKAFYICNSDKYSFALNFQAIPPQQRSMIVANFEAEFAQMKEMASEEQLLDQTLQSNSVFIQYIQDLYRFFKIFPSRSEFEDIFQIPVQFDELYFYQNFFEKKGYPEKLATFYFEKEHYLKAIHVYESLAAKGPPQGAIYEKIAYCYQKLSRYKKAVEYYKMAELFDSDRLWILKKLGWCSMKLKDYQAALGFYKDAAKFQPDDLNLSTQIAQCCLNLKDFEQALQYYSKVIFFNPGNIKVLRPIAYCHFLTGKLEQAEEAYEELLTHVDHPSSYDLMNAGHVQLCLGKRKEAFDLYRKCMANTTLNTNDLMNAFDEDVPYLMANEISEEEIPLIKDHLLYQRDPK